MNGQEFGFSFITNSPVNSATVLWFLFGLVVVITVFMYGSYWIQRRRKQLAFLSEMVTLGLNANQEGTLASIVKRYRMHEPVSLLLSEKLFDEMATREMVRILGSQAPADTKEKYIQELYAIKQRTYNHDFSRNGEACGTQ